MMAKSCADKQWLDQERKKIAQQRLQEHPDYVLIDVIKSPKCKLNCFERKTLLVPHSYPLFMLTQDIRDRISGIDKSQALFCYVGKTSLAKSNAIVGELYSQYKDSDGFLQIEFSDINTYG